MRAPGRRARRRSVRCRRTTGSARGAARRRGRRSARRCRGRPCRCRDRAPSRVQTRSRAARPSSTARSGPPIVGSAGLSVGSERRIVGGTSRSVSGRSRPYWRNAVSALAGLGARGTARPGSVGTPSGERAASASSASGSIASLSCSGPSGLVNSSAPVGALLVADQRQRGAAGARPQPALDPLLARQDGGGRQPLEHREAPGRAADLGRAAVDHADVQLARASACSGARSRPSTSSVAPAGFIRSASGASRRPDSNGSSAVRPAPAPAGGGAEDIGCRS